MFPEVEGVGGDLKSKYQRKTSFLKRSRLEIFFFQKMKTFYAKLLKLDRLNQKREKNDHKNVQQAGFGLLELTGRLMCTKPWDTRNHLEFTECG